MKKNKIYMNTTVKLWIIHLLIYYFIFSILYVLTISFYTGLSFNSQQSLTLIILSPVIGFMGFFDLIPGFAIVPILVMLGLYKFIYIGQIYKSYFISILVVRVLHYILMIVTKSINQPFLTSIKIEINMLFFIIPSLAITLLINWYLFGRYENCGKIHKS